MTESFVLLDQFRAVHGRRFRYVKRTWWVWNEGQWSHLDALTRMQQALIGIAREVFAPKHKVHGQLEHAYILRAMEMRLREHLVGETLPSDPDLQ